MYTPSVFAEARPAVLRELIRRHPLATFVVAGDAGIAINHLPFHYATGVGRHGVLRGHVPRSNDVWEALDGSRPAVAVFHGPQAYVSPSWYPSKQAHGKAVPTWNYAVVHARGSPRAIHDEAWLLEHLNALTNTQEAASERPWRVDDAPADFTATLVGGLVGIEIPIAAIEGKWKVSQNRASANRRGVAAGLRLQGDSHSLAVAELVLSRLEDDETA